MWIPKPIYDNAPRYWVLVGTLLLIVGIYVGLEVHPVFFLVGGGAGLGSVIWGLRVNDKRRPERLFETSSFDTGTIKRNQARKSN